jgi:hypothetical protein
MTSTLPIAPSLAQVQTLSLAPVLSARPAYATQGGHHRTGTLEARQLALQEELATVVAPAPLIHPKLAEIYRQRVEQLHEALYDSKRSANGPV